MFKDNLKYYRKKSGLTQKELSSLTGISYSTITKLENGTLKNPSQGIVAAISIVLKVNISDLQGLQDEKNPFSFLDEEGLNKLDKNGFNRETWVPDNSVGGEHYLAIANACFGYFASYQGKEMKLIPRFENGTRQFILSVDNEEVDTIDNDVFNAKMGEVTDYFIYKFNEYTIRG